MNEGGDTGRWYPADDSDLHSTLDVGRFGSEVGKFFKAPLWISAPGLVGKVGVVGARNEHDGAKHDERPESILIVHALYMTSHNEASNGE